MNYKVIVSPIAAKNIEDAVAIREGRLKAESIPEENRDYYLERILFSIGNETQ